MLFKTRCFMKMRVVINLSGTEEFWKPSSTSDICLESGYEMPVLVQACMLYVQVSMFASRFMYLWVCERVWEEAVVR